MIEMLDPGLALAAALVVLAIVGYMFWPRAGIVARLQRARRHTRRIKLEDALKHLYDCEYRKVPCTHQSLSGALGVSGDEAAALLMKLESHGLSRHDGDHFVLTEEGRSNALRIVRLHRLWERYLADETGTKETEWHAEAELVEHHLTDADAHALTVQLGDPRYDPHGDPIPTVSGELPKRRDTPLTQLAAGDLALVVHVEDEPPAVYAQLVAQGVNPGTRLRILESTDRRIRFEADGVENVLAPVVAANVTTVRLPAETPIEGPHESLADLAPGETGRVIRVAHACRGIQRRRLMDLGIVPGTRISAEMRSASGDPTAYMIRGATIALRRTQARFVHIVRETETMA